MTNNLIQFGDSPSFIAGRKIDAKVCDGIVDYYNEFPHKVRGTYGNQKVDLSHKDSMDVGIPPLFQLRPRDRDPRLVSYFQELSSVSKEYTEMFPALESLPWSQFEGTMGPDIQQRAALRWRQPGRHMHNRRCWFGAVE